MDVLIESKKQKGKWVGFSAEYCRVAVESEADIQNRIIPVKISEFNENLLSGVSVDNQSLYLPIDPSSDI